MTEVYSINRQSDLALDLGGVQALVEAVWRLEGRVAEEVSISFVSKDEIAQLHGEYFDDPSPTDCVSFPQDDRILGDVVVCPAVAHEYVQSSGGDVYEETTLYILHGLLHLLGYDDVAPHDVSQMRMAEQRHIENLRSHNLLLRAP